jgi:hypothetical protein
MLTAWRNAGMVELAGVDVPVGLVARRSTDRRFTVWLGAGPTAWRAS